MKTKIYTSVFKKEPPTNPHGIEIGDQICFPYESVTICAECKHRYRGTWYGKTPHTKSPGAIFTDDDDFVVHYDSPRCSEGVTQDEDEDCRWFKEEG